MKTNHTRLLSLLSLTLPLALGGCGVIGGGNTDGGGKSDGGAGDMASAGVEAKFSSLYSDYLGNCKDCHAPSAPGRGADTEKNLDFSTAAKAYSTLTTAKAAGLTGNFMSCNGVSFVVAGKPAESLALAAVDEPTRMAFASGACTKDTISDMTVKVGQEPSAAFLAAFKSWIQAGAPNN